MFCRPTLGSKLFPTIGFRTINELSSLEDLPDLETDKISNELLHYGLVSENSKRFLDISEAMLLGGG